MLCDSLCKDTFSHNLKFPQFTFKMSQGQEQEGPGVWSGWVDDTVVVVKEEFPGQTHIKHMLDEAFAAVALRKLSSDDLPPVAVSPPFPSDSLLPLSRAESSSLELTPSLLPSPAVENVAPAADRETYRRNIVDVFRPDNELHLNPVGAYIPLPDDLPFIESPPSGLTSDPTKLFILLSPKSLIHNNACAAEKYTSVIYSYQGSLSPGKTINQSFALSVCLRIHGSPITYFTPFLEIKSSQIDDVNHLIKVDFKINKVSSKVDGCPYSFSLVMRPREPSSLLVAQVAESGDIVVRSAKAKAPSLTKVEEKLLSHEWINCYCSSGCPRFCPFCRVPEQTRHKTTCLFHDIQLKQHRADVGPMKKRKLK